METEEITKDQEVKGEKKPDVESGDQADFFEEIDQVVDNKIAEKEAVQIPPDDKNEKPSDKEEEITKEDSVDDEDSDTDLFLGFFIPRKHIKSYFNQ